MEVCFAMLIVHTYVLLLMCMFLLYSLFKGSKATGLGKKANLFVFLCELEDNDGKTLL